tara:strand:+ start:571 stop:921 length:351 start_codon:yes stop_codon:yes gene_type:complete
MKNEKERTEKESIDFARRLVEAVPALARLSWNAEGAFLTTEGNPPINRRALNREIKRAHPSFRKENGSRPDYYVTIDGFLVMFQYSPYPEAKGYIQVSECWGTRAADYDAVTGEPV